MAITDEITRVIRDRIQSFEGPAAESATTSVGTVISVADGIARVYGLSGAHYLELLEFTRTNTFGIAFNLEEDSVAVPIMGDYTHLRENDEVRTTGRIISVPVGDALSRASRSRCRYRPA
jgi:F-type H+-transporting ATPase subunit alpha